MAKRKKAVIDGESPEGVDSHDWMLQKLKEAQEADHDNREKARQASAFVDERTGQWEEKWYNDCAGKPRYTFDLTSPIVDQVQSVLMKADFTVKVLPGSGDASKECAEVYDGLVRNIEAISNAREVYSKAGKGMAKKGLDGWLITQRYVDGDSFDQDLVIEWVPDWINSVWFSPHTEQDASDADMAWRLVGMTPEDFKARYPDQTVNSSVGTDRTETRYYYRPDLIMVGQYWYKKEEPRELVLMTNGRVYEVNDEFKAVADDLALLGVTEQARRKRKKVCVYSRMFSEDGWLGEPQKTVFENWIPLVPLYANFDVVEEGKIIYYGAVEKLIDPQQVFNYSLSREIEEGALAPRAKYWMTPKQAAGHKDTLETLNTNSDPIQLFNVDPELPGAPQQIGGAQINPGLARISEAMQSIIGASAGMFAANMGENPGLQSGKAIEALQDRGDWGNNKYLESRTIAQRQTGRILVDTIPRVYLPSRQVRLLSEDGTFEVETIGDEVIDNQTGRVVVLNDLSKGQYDVTCTAGPAFQTRQSQTVTALTEVGAIDPSVIGIGGDILLKNISAPGMDLLAQRKRRQLFQAGMIPIEQMTDEEKAELQQMQNQPPQEDANMVLARAEEAKAQADLIDAQTKQFETQAQVEQKNKELQIKAFEAETDRYKAEIERGKALAEIQGKQAQAAKVLAEAEAIDIDNDAKTSGIAKVIERIQAGV